MSVTKLLVEIASIVLMIPAVRNKNVLNALVRITHGPFASGFEKARSLSSLGQIACFYNARYDEAEPRLKAALELLEASSLIEGPAASATTCRHLGHFYLFTLDRGEALKYLQQAHEIMGDLPQAVDSNHETGWSGWLGPPEVLKTSETIAELHMQDENYEEALAMWQSILTSEEGKKGGMHLDIAKILNTIAIIYSELGEIDESVQYWERTLSIRKELLGSQHIDGMHCCQCLPTWWPLLICYTCSFKSAREPRSQ